MTAGNPGVTDGLPTYAELLERTDAPAGSVWGLFGADDEIGALNLLTPVRVQRATGLVCSGEVVACGRRLAVAPAADNPSAVRCSRSTSRSTRSQRRAARRPSTP